MSDIYLDKAAPHAYAALIELNRQAGIAASEAGLQPLLVELIKLRASQINGCAFCLRMHARDAISAGETIERIAILPAWRDTDYFTEAERAALAITEEVTLIADGVLGERAQDELYPELDDAQIAAVRWVAITINSFNRVSILSHHPVEPD